MKLLFTYCLYIAFRITEKYTYSTMGNFDEFDESQWISQTLVNQYVLNKHLSNHQSLCHQSC